MSTGRTADPMLGAQVDSVLAASRVLVAVSARSMGAVDDAVTPIQMRTLVILASRGPLRATDLAHALGVHPSNATRACDKLAEAGFLDRRENPANRRALIISLTPRGQRVITSITRRRARAIAEVLRAIPGHRRAAIVAAMGEFAAAGGESEDTDLWSMGWTT